MRRASIAGGLLIGALAAWAGADARAQATTRPPARRPSPPVAASVPAAESDADTGTVAFDAGGVRVILRRNAANDVIAANLYLLGGVRVVADSNAGIEPFLLLVSEQGTARYPKERLRKAMARVGTTIVVNAENDWTMLGIRATRSTMDSTWAVFADRLMHPTVDSAEVERLRAQLLSAVRQQRAQCLMEPRPEVEAGRIEGVMRRRAGHGRNL